MFEVFCLEISHFHTVKHESPLFPLSLALIILIYMKPFIIMAAKVGMELTCCVQVTWGQHFVQKPLLLGEQNLAAAPDLPWERVPCRTRGK